MKCRYKLIGHTSLWVQWKLRYDQASPRDLLGAKRASPGLKLVSPGRRTCELDRPERRSGYEIIKQNIPGACICFFHHTDQVHM